ncbi:MAG: hypothetical protein OJK14_09255 [Achromobacter sp.]|nr:hypothetical protein [Achromobacter sp.]MCW0207276.1 hypothetical protein [Achromobacter sp.]
MLEALREAFPEALREGFRLAGDSLPEHLAAVELEHVSRRSSFW